jgi:hypothetical protein
VNIFPRQRIYETVKEFSDASFSVRLSVGISLPLLGNNSVKTFQLQRRIVEGVVLYAVRVPKILVRVIRLWELIELT